MRYFLRVLRYARPYWRWGGVSILFTVLASLLALLEPWPLKILFDSVLGRHPLPGPVEPLLAPLWDDRFLLMVVVVLGGFGLTLLGNGLTVLNSYVDTRLERERTADLAERADCRPGRTRTVRRSGRTKARAFHRLHSSDRGDRCLNARS